MKESEIAARAIKNLNKITGINIEYSKQSIVGKLADGIINFKTSPGIKLQAEIKNEIRQSHVHALIEKNKKNQRFIIICRYIPMPVKNILQKEKINYLETSGNCYIDRKNFFLHISDQKVSKERETGKSKIWNAAGLRFVFAIVQNPDLLNQPYRTIANEAMVALGTVGKLIEELQKEGYVKSGKKEDQTFLFLERKNELINKWVVIYNTVLRPKISAGKFRAIGTALQNNKNLPAGILWGGEMAGAKLTKFLRPEKLQLYISLQKTDVMKLLKLVPDTDGTIELINIFWNNQIKSGDRNKTQTVPPLIVYADLLASHDSRNYETAERIKIEYLERQN